MTAHVIGQAPAPPAVSPIPSLPSRVAVISAPDAADLAALMTVELSSNPDIQLVERDDLAKVGDEFKLQQLAGSDAVALGKLIGADGLVFLGKGPNGLQVRFTGVGLGYALFDDQVGSEKDLPELAKSIAHRVAGYLPKLKINPTKAIPVSVLNLRADDATADSTALERKLTLLLESRLASVPEYVVLERRHAWAVGFERALDPAVSPLLQGSYLIDGSFDETGRERGSITIHLRLRTPTGPDREAVISGPVEDLIGLADRMALEIHGLIGSVGPLPVWSRGAESAEYLKEARWARQHGTDDQTREALDAAELLGGSSPDLRALRLQSLCDRAGRGLDLSDGQLPGPLPVNSYALHERADDLIRALDLAREGVPPDQLISVTSKVLYLMDEAHAPRADELREALRSLTHYDPLHGSLGAGGQLEILYFSDLYADEWSGSLPEELAYFRALCVGGGWLPPVLLANGNGFCPRFLTAPGDQQKAYAAFVASVKDEPRARLAWLLINAASPDRAVADAAFSSYIGELWKRREELTRANGLRPEWNNARTLSPGANNWRPIVDELFTRHASEMVPLLRYFLTHWNATESGFALEFLWQPAGWSDAEAAAIWPDYQRYRERLVDYWKTTGNNLSALPIQLAPFEDPFRKRFPQIASSSSKSRNSKKLVVTRYWHAWLAPDAPRQEVMYRTWATAPNGLWMFCTFDNQENWIYRIELPGLQTKGIPLPKGLIAQQLRASMKALYIDYLGGPNNAVHGLARYDFAGKSWELHPINVPFMNFYNIGDAVYLNLREVDLVKGGEAGVARYDWAKDQVMILADTRRNPAQSPFDDRSGDGIQEADVQNVFSGPSGRACIDTASGVFFLPKVSGAWSPVFDSAYGTQSVTSNGQTLIVTHDGEIVLISPEKSAPEYLMAPRTQTFRKFPLSKIRETASWFGQTRWNVPDHPEFSADGYCSNNVAYHSGRLFVLVAPVQAGGSYDLLVYSTNTGRNPRHVELKFQLDERTKALLDPLYRAHGGSNWNAGSIEHPGFPFFSLNLIATGQGLCFHMFSGGVWFLPYEQLMAYLKKADVATQQASDE